MHGGPLDSWNSWAWRWNPWLLAAKGYAVLLPDPALSTGYGAKMVALNQRDARTKWGQLEVFMTRWRDIEPLTAEPGPFIWRASRTAMTPISLAS